MFNGFFLILICDLTKGPLYPMSIKLSFKISQVFSKKTETFIVLLLSSWVLIKIAPNGNYVHSNEEEIPNMCLETLLAHASHYPLPKPLLQLKIIV